MKYGLIISLCKERNIQLSDLAEKINSSRSGLYRSLRDQTLTVEKIEKIAEVLNVPVSQFFEPGGNQQKLGELEEKNEELRTMVGVLLDVNITLKFLTMHVWEAYLDYLQAAPGKKPERLTNLMQAINDLIENMKNEDHAAKIDSIRRYYLGAVRLKKSGEPGE